MPLLQEESLKMIRPIIIDIRQSAGKFNCLVSLSVTALVWCCCRYRSIQFAEEKLCPLIFKLMTSWTIKRCGMRIVSGYIYVSVIIITATISAHPPHMRPMQINGTAAWQTWWHGQQPPQPRYYSHSTGTRWQDGVQEMLDSHRKHSWAHLDWTLLAIQIELRRRTTAHDNVRILIATISMIADILLPLLLPNPTPNQWHRRWVVRLPPVSVSFIRRVDEPQYL